MVFSFKGLLQGGAPVQLLLLKSVSGSGGLKIINLFDNTQDLCAYLEKLVNSPNLNFGAERLVGSSPTVSI